MGNPKLFEDVVNPKTGEHSLTENIRPKVVMQWCKFEDHDFEYLNGNLRLVKCKKCGHEQDIILGFHELKNGKIVNRV